MRPRGSSISSNPKSTRLRIPNTRERPAPRPMKNPLSLALILLTSQAAIAFEPQEDGIFAVFDTSRGEFTAKIAYQAVPLTAANFIGLAEGSIPRFDPTTGEIIEQKPFYDGLTFNVVAQNTFIQSGDPDRDDPAIDGPGYTLPEELHPNLTHNPDYSISMANGSCTDCPGTPDIGDTSTGSQFFITAAALPGQPPAGYNFEKGYSNFDGFFAVFGIVIDGTDVIDAIGDVPVDPLNGRPIEDVTINKVTIVREGPAAEAFTITDYDIPYRLPAPKIEAIPNDVDSIDLSFEAAPAISYTVETSDNLKDWTPTEFINDQDASTTIVIPATPDAPLFARSRQPSRAPVDFALPFSNLKMDTVLSGAVPGENWNFDFKADGTGTVTIQREGEPISSPIDFYTKTKIPNGIRFRISMYDIRHEMVIHLKYVSETSGGLYVWIDDYISGNPLRYPVAGTFTYAE